MLRSLGPCVLEPHTSLPSLTHALSCTFPETHKSCSQSICVPDFHPAALLCPPPFAGPPTRPQGAICLALDRKAAVEPRYILHALCAAHPRLQDGLALWQTRLLVCRWERPGAAGPQQQRASLKDIRATNSSNSQWQPVLAWC